mmetsp:Transcript_43112/g.128766  ORF Transcript_43112/g.128766 Transcript_43112/m.128766 type:complete len:208 (-) Transcript_43112:523-1146(-)
MLESVEHAVHAEVREPGASHLLDLPVELLAAEGPGAALAHGAERRPAEAVQWLGKVAVADPSHQVLRQLHAPAVVARGHGHRDVQRGRVVTGGGLVEEAAGYVEHVVGLHRELHDGLANELFGDRALLAEHLLRVRQQPGSITDGPALLAPDLHKEDVLVVVVQSDGLGAGRRQVDHSKDMMEVALGETSAELEDHRVVPVCLVDDQ